MSCRTRFGIPRKSVTRVMLNLFRHLSKVSNSCHAELVSASAPFAYRRRWQSFLAKTCSASKSVMPNLFRNLSKVFSRDSDLRRNDIFPLLGSGQPEQTVRVMPAAARLSSLCSCSGTSQTQSKPLFRLQSAGHRLFRKDR